AAPGDIALRVFGLWHGSVVEGPGRRSVVQTSGCSLRCPGCIAEEAWDPRAGRPLGIAAVATALLDPVGAPRDGVTVLGGEPFEQPEALAALLAELRLRAPGLHLTVYSGYTLAALARRPEPAVRRALDLADLLIDGPFVRRLAAGAGEWRGSRNQRLIPHPGRLLAARGR
ncbi:MAG TPA: 4Fe-4S single cluster domain-containing protein, partial [Thermomicrobiales bacterium]|nr:4Fe-4S single cluster domain-containing protein [Thermomicrobiales bacterium]